jgi:hypothetical protein
MPRRRRKLRFRFKKKFPFVSLSGTRVPDSGYCTAVGRGYESCHKTLRAAVKAGRALTSRLGRRVDLVHVTNRGEDRHIIGEMFPKYARKR